MRAIIVGAGEMGIMTAQRLIDWGDEVILIERDEQKAGQLADELDCTVVTGDGSRPEILRKAQVEAADWIIALTNSDQDNIIVALVARTFKDIETIVKIDRPSFIPISRKLGLRNMVTPHLTASAQLSQLTRGVDILELVNLIRFDARFHHMIIDASLAGRTLGELDLPEEAIAFALYRQREFLIPKPDLTLREEDELVFAVKAAHLKELLTRLGS
jgi:trk system potassium uptake protein TrkA